MSRYYRKRPSNTKEHILAKKMSKVVTDDFACDLDGAGYYIAADYPPIIFHRLETIYLAAKDEYDRIMGNEVTTEGYGKW